MRRLITTLGLAAAILTPAAASAQAFCGDRDAVTERLTTGYGESLAAGGLRNADSVVEVWSSEEKGTWTILMTKADGTTCILAAGTHWHQAEKQDKVAGVKG